ncbi:MAG: hypothetical protein J0H74_26685 [Chitinophagaceae bacterium]|nr:hypothetical protein [Chitinophagaceae bacterium]
MKAKQERITVLLEKYWQAETTVEEEKELAEYFRGPGVPPEWESYRELFSFFEEKAQIKPSPELEGRIMESIRPRHHMVWWAAAAAIVLMLGLEPLFRHAPERVHVEQPGLVMTDTYDDPEQALAAVQKALFTVSKKMNKGLHPIK